MNIAALIALITSPIGRWIAGGLVAISALWGFGEYRYLQGRSAYKAKIEREIADAKAKGDAAREQALRNFDALPDDGSVPDDGFRRP